MFKNLIPLIGIVAAVAVFFMYVYPTFGDIQDVQAELADYDDAIALADRLQSRIDELQGERNKIPQTSIERLEVFLPNEVQEVSFLIDAQELAESNGLSVDEVKIGGSRDQSGTDAAEQTPPAEEPGFEAGADSGAFGTPDEAGAFVDEGINPNDQYEALQITLSLTGTYDQFRGFLSDLEGSLVLTEVTEITFATSENSESGGGDTFDFTVTAELYELKPPRS